MIIPYSTDAPIYHWPVATVGLIVANIGIFVAVLTGSFSTIDVWVLPYGEGLTPLQWFTSMFMHLNIEHLVGNMIFLWVFGIVIEGKIGWWRFLLCYLGIGVTQSAGEQVLQLMLHGEGGSLGASSAIYGLLAMAAIWAPKNEITFFYWLAMIFTGTVDVAILAVAGAYIGLDILMAYFLGLNSSSWLHVGGAMLGAPLAIFMLKRGLVDCEGWDLFHVMRDEKGGLSKVDEAVDRAELSNLQQQRDAKLLANANDQIATYLEAGHDEAALKLYQKLRDVGDGLQLPRKYLVKLIAALHKQKRWRESCPLMAEVLARFPDGSEAIGVKLAQIRVVELKRPGQALDLLRALDLEKLPKKSIALVQKIAQHAKKMQSEGVIELENEAW